MGRGKKQMNKQVTIIIVGDSNGGKSTFLRSFQDNYIHKDELKPTSGFNKETLKIRYQKQKIILHFIDTSGQQKFNSITINTYKHATCFLFLLDIQSDDLKDKINTWINFVRDNYNKQTYNNFETIIKICVLNKIDLINVSKMEEIKTEVLKDINIPVFLCSSIKKIDDYTPHKIINFIMKKFFKIDDPNDDSLIFDDDYISSSEEEDIVKEEPIILISREIESSNFFDSNDCAC